MGSSIPQKVGFFWQVPQKVVLDSVPKRLSLAVPDSLQTSFKSLGDIKETSASTKGSKGVKELAADCVCHLAAVCLEKHKNEKPFKQKNCKYFWEDLFRIEGGPVFINRGNGLLKSCDS